MAGIFQNQAAKPRYIPKVKKTEESVQRRVCRYLRVNHPSVIFRSDYSAGLHLTKNQSVINKSLQSGRGFPDLFVFEPRLVDGVQYYGLGLEIKKANTSLIVKIGPRKGHLVSNKHIQEQYLMLKELKRKGYYTAIAAGYDNCIKVIDKYLGVEAPENGSIF